MAAKSHVMVGVTRGKGRVTTLGRKDWESIREKGEVSFPYLSPSFIDDKADKIKLAVCQKKVNSLKGMEKLAIPMR